MARLGLLGLVLALSGCGGGSAPDAGPADAGPADAGPCSPSAQTGCAPGQKCSLDDNLEPACVAAGSAPAYAACQVDSACAPGTYCTDPGPLPADRRGYQTGPACYPFCNPAQQLRQACTLGGECILTLVGTPDIGLCDRALDGGAGDGG